MGKNIDVWLRARSNKQPLLTNGAYLRWRYGGEYVKNFRVEGSEEDVKNYICWLLLEGIFLIDSFRPSLLDDNINCLSERFDGLSRLQWAILRQRPDVFEHFSADGDIDFELFERWTEDRFFDEYPNVAAYLDEQSAFFHEEVPNSAWLRWVLSPSLRHRFDLETSEGRFDYYCWMLLENEEKSFPSMRLTSENVNALNEMVGGVNRLERSLLRIRNDLGCVYNVDDEISLRNFRKWLDDNFALDYPNLARCLNSGGSVINKLDEDLPVVSSFKYYNKKIKFEKSGDGRVINLIGYATAQLGIGEDVRMLYRALKCSSYRINLIDISDELLSDKNESELSSVISDVVVLGGISIFCCTAPEFERLLLRFGQEFYEQSYCIGYFPWELTKWPEKWDAAEILVDRVWVSTSFIKEAFLPSLKKPVAKVPLIVEYDYLPTRNRKAFGIDEETFVCLFIFDSLSYMARKNPLAHVRAFRKAFPSNENVLLVIKTMNRDKINSPLWQALISEVDGDDRIKIINETMDKTKLLSLYASIDVYLSLHRSEGFGRTIAEAMLYEKPVVVTGYSGNLDFCNSDNSCLVTGEIIDVGKDEYPFSEDSMWFDPDVSIASEHLRLLFQSPLLRQAKGVAGKQTIKGFGVDLIYSKFIVPELEIIERDRASTAIGR